VSGFAVRTEQKPAEGVSVAQPGNKAEVLDVLFVERPPGISRHVTPLGIALADTLGRTLYSAPEACDSSCLRNWQPVQAPWSSKAVGEWSLISRMDGTIQWAFRDQALYTCKRDSKPNIATCEGNGWRAVVAAPAPELPDGVGQQATSLGRIYVDHRGHTLYMLVGDRKEFEREICDQACINDLWIPVAAPNDAQGIGEWQPVASGATKFLGHLFGGASVSAKNYWSALPPEIADMSSPRQSRP
jgi:predicted lipoprotein with Yx(FWY)xxD motif